MKGQSSLTKHQRKHKFILYSTLEGTCPGYSNQLDMNGETPPYLALISHLKRAIFSPHINSGWGKFLWHLNFSVFLLNRTGGFSPLLPKFLSFWVSQSSTMPQETSSGFKNSIPFLRSSVQYQYLWQDVSLVFCWDQK